MLFPHAVEEFMLDGVFYSDSGLRVEVEHSF